MIMRKIFAIAAVSAISLAAFAQNGNHTVEVTNDYISQLSGLQKTNIEMAVPDSLLHFDYKFDYSVFETPYKGAYEFSPYHIHVQPQASKYDAGKFYLRAGAGYSIRPVLEFAAAAVTKPEFAMTIYNDGSGFYGRNLAHEVIRASDPDMADPFMGYDVSDRFGVDMHIIRPKFSTKVGAAYDLIAAGGDCDLKSMLHSGSIGLSVAPVGASSFDYRFGASFRYTADNANSGSKASEALASVNGMVGFGIGSSSALAIDFDLATDVSSLEGEKNNFALFSATPSYNFTAGVFSIKAGARVDYSTARTFSVTPAVKASARIFKDKLIFVAGADGGQTVSDYFSMKSAYHRTFMQVAVPGVNKELIHAYAGFDGHAGHVFEWGLRAGYHNWKSKACESVVGFNYANVSLLYLDGRFALKSERIDFDGDFRIAKSKLIETADIFSTPLASGNVRFMYNRNKRLYAGVWAQGQTSRKGMWQGADTSLPGWVNLGVSAEYKFSTKLGLWIEGGNLLCQEIWRNPVCAEKDPYATVGICLKF